MTKAKARNTLRNGPRLNALLGAYTRFTRRWADTLRVLSMCFDVLVVIASMCCLITVALYAGFDDTVIPYSMVAPWLRACQTVFAVNILFNVLLRTRSYFRDRKPLRWVADALLLLSLIMVLWPHPQNPWWPRLTAALSSHALSLGILAGYSAVYLSYALIRSMGKRTNPSLILGSSFLIFIVIGTALLMLPRCTYAGIDVADSFFVSTSAVCICGLTTVDVAATFTPMGLSVIAVLMQVGALGVMTFTSFFALFFSGRPSIYSQLMVKDMIYSKSINSLLPTLLYILMFTLTVEAVGALAIYWSVVDTIAGYTGADYAWFAVFHSISAFCNAGFSNIEGGLSNPALLHGNQLVYIAVTGLVVAGGIGFPILANAKDAVMWRLSNLWRRLKGLPDGHRANLYNVNSRVTMLCTSVLFVLTALLFFVFERNNTLSGFTIYKQLVQSFFNAATPRSAGFMSVNPASFLPVTLLWVMFMMWIGGGSQSTAGGIKVNTFAAALLNLRASINGRTTVQAFNRTISAESLSRANAVIILSIISYVIITGLLMLLEPAIPVKMLAFESLSGLFAVGSSLGATPLLGVGGKLLISLSMFIGRVGLLSLLMGLASHNHHRQPLQMPSDNLIIN